MLRMTSEENLSVLRRCSQTSFKSSTDGDGSFKRRSIHDISEANCFRSIIFSNAKDQKTLVPHAAEYHIPHNLKDDVRSFDDRMSGLLKEQDQLKQTQQQLCDKVNETQKQLQQLPVQQKMLNIIAEQLHELNKRIDALNKKIV